LILFIVRPPLINHIVVETQLDGSVFSAAGSSNASFAGGPASMPAAEEDDGGAPCFAGSAGRDASGATCLAGAGGKCKSDISMQQAKAKGNEPSTVLPEP